MDTNAANLALLGLREAAGVVMFAHGWNHLARMREGPGVSNWFASLGLHPAPVHAWLVTVVELSADRVGHYRGDCAEFCGLQHAHMGLVVVAQPAPAFRRWLAAQSRPAAPPQSESARRGERVFVDGACSSCHAIRGSDAHGFVGPDLTHVASRNTLGALTVLNTRDNLTEWVRDSQHLKPGNQMPASQLGPTRLQAVVDYLEALK